MEALRRRLDGTVGWVLGVLVVGLAVVARSAPRAVFLGAAARAQAPVAHLAGAAAAAPRGAATPRARAAAIWWTCFALVTAWVSSFMTYHAPCAAPTTTVRRDGVDVARLAGVDADACRAAALALRVLSGLAAAVQVFYLLASLFLAVYDGLLVHAVPSSLPGVLTLSFVWQGPRRTTTTHPKRPRGSPAAAAALVALVVWTAALAVLELRTALYSAVTPPAAAYGLVAAFGVGLEVSGGGTLLGRWGALVPLVAVVGSLVVAAGDTPAAACAAAVAVFDAPGARGACESTGAAARVLLGMQAAAAAARLYLVRRRAGSAVVIPLNERVRDDGRRARVGESASDMLFEAPERLALLVRGKHGRARREQGREVGRAGV
jgi:hypothetical protein